MSQKTNRSLERAIDILFAFNHDQPMLTIEEIAQATEIPKSTCYRFISTLKRKGLIEVDGDASRYRLGVRLLVLHSVILDSLDISQIVLPFIQQLSHISGETAQLVWRNHNVAVCIEKVESPEMLRVRPDKGTIIGLHSGASGKAILAFLPEIEQDRIIRETGLPKLGPRTITDPEELKESLAGIRRLGYATSDQELYVGVKALAAPIFNADEQIVASVCLAGPRDRFDQKKVASLVNPVVEAANSISRRLGSARDQLRPKVIRRRKNGYPARNDLD